MTIARDGVDRIAGLDAQIYRDRMREPMRPCPLADLAKFVRGERRRGRGWQTIAQLTGWNETDLRRRFGGIHERP